MQFMKFPNGKVWRMTEDFRIRGVIRVPNFESGMLEDNLDRISYEATGSDIGLTDFHYQHLGDGLVSFNGTAFELQNFDEDEIPEGHQIIEVISPELREALMEQYGFSEVEVDHALVNLENDYGPENELPILGSARQIRTPDRPQECSYVRIVVDDYEIGYWNSDEWGKDPMPIMGALMGAARGSDEPSIIRRAAP